MYKKYVMQLTGAEGARMRWTRDYDVSVRFCAMEGPWGWQCAAQGHLVRGTLGLILGLLAAVSMAISASAAGYPSRLITLVVPYAAGGGLDQLARQLGAKLADR